MAKRAKRRPVAEINVVPYIDVMLVLLVIFMITAPLITAGVNVDLPQESAAPLSTDSETPIIASIDKQGLYYLSVGDSKDQSLEPDELAVLVRAYLAEKPKAPVMVNGDKSISYEQVMRLMVLLQAAGVDNVGLMVDSSESK